MAMYSLRPRYMVEILMYTSAVFLSSKKACVEIETGVNNPTTLQLDGRVEHSKNGWIFEGTTTCDS
jgi:hypothetical protein